MCCLCFLTHLYVKFFSHECFLFQIHGGILARSTENDEADLAARKIRKIRFVICNLYPFVETLKRTEDESEIIENIDIGGVTLLRAAAKNHARVTVLADPSDYSRYSRSVLFDHCVFLFIFCSSKVKVP